MTTREKRLEAALLDVMGDAPDFFPIELGMVQCRFCGRQYAASEAPVSVLECSEDCSGRVGRTLLTGEAS
jgi:hypothetical protein